MTERPLILVAAVARDRTIGKDGDMPWRVRGDLQAFRRTTMGHPVVMGRRTWESLPTRPLAGRANIVVTRDRRYAAEGAERAHSLDDALALADKAAAATGATAIMVIGGANLFAETIGRADSLILTEIDAAPAGDTFFPSIDRDVWREMSREPLPASDGDTASAQRVIYERR